MVRVKCKSASLDWRGKKFVSGKEVELTSPADISAARLCPDLAITFDDHVDVPVPVPVPEAGAKGPSFPGAEAPTPEPLLLASADEDEGDVPVSAKVIPSPAAAAPGVPVRRGPGRPPKAK
jgi:hypothetical protein